MFLRLEDRIKELCHEAAATSNSPKLDEILQDLKAALSEHTRRPRTGVAGFTGRVRPARRWTDRPSSNTTLAERSEKDQSRNHGMGKL